MLLLPLALAALLTQQPETMSLLKEPLYPPPVQRAERARLEGDAAQARSELAKDPANAVAIVRLARAQRALGHVGDALETLTRALEGKADTPAIHLERGRDFIVIRKFELAQKELRKAVETVPEAHCDIGFTLYLLADYTQAHDEYGKCRQPDVFGYFAARRAGVEAGPPPAAPEADTRDTAIKLPGSLTAQTPKGDASIYATYSSAVERLLQGDKKAARELLQPVLEKQQDRWMEPMYIAAEADCARIAPPKKKKRKT
jgi:tetratricopeptide (TPR) repeat protein